MPPRVLSNGLGSLPMSARWIILFNVSIASGLVAGESLIKALLAILATGIGLASRG